MDINKANLTLVLLDFLSHYKCWS